MFRHTKICSYYIDKTLLIKDLIDLKGKVNLFIRPRRFGKTLNLSMLRYFFEKSDVNPAPLFEGTKIWDAIPNMEVLHIYKHTVLLWFEEKIKMKDLSELYRSILDGDRKKLSEFLSEMLMETISFYDYQENYYHGFLAGLLKHFGDYIVVSNRESGSGRPDLILKYPSVRGKAVIFEIKTADSYQDLECKCDEALQQIEERHYADSLRKEGYQTILKYGIAFYKKECMVK